MPEIAGNTTDTWSIAHVHALHVARKEAHRYCGDEWYATPLYLRGSGARACVTVILLGAPNVLTAVLIDMAMQSTARNKELPSMYKLFAALGITPQDASRPHYSTLMERAYRC